MLNEGFIQVYTGNGKGKTTAAMGLIFRAIGRNLKAEVIQFIKKGEEYGEVISLKKNKVNIRQFGDGNFILNGKPEKSQIQLVKNGLDEVRKIMESEQFCDILLLDEFNTACYFEMISEQEAMEIIRLKPHKMELILTGRNAPQFLIDNADLVTEMSEIKHYYNKGVKSRIGIEF